MADQNLIESNWMFIGRGGEHKSCTQETTIAASPGSHLIISNEDGAIAHYFNCKVQQHSDWVHDMGDSPVYLLHCVMIYALWGFLICQCLNLIGFIDGRTAISATHLYGGSVHHGITLHLGVNWTVN